MNTKAKIRAAWKIRVDAAVEKLIAIIEEGQAAMDEKELVSRAWKFGSRNIRIKSRRTRAIMARRAAAEQLRRDIAESTDKVLVGF